jgi:hypothetical protein
MFAASWVGARRPCGDGCRYRGRRYDGGRGGTCVAKGCRSDVVVCVWALLSCHEVEEGIEALWEVVVGVGAAGLRGFDAFWCRGNIELL